jgi:small subunit ribosomal protein S13
MPRLAGVDLKKNQRIEYALTGIYGLGLTLSREILDKAGIEFGLKSDDLTEPDIVKLRALLQEYKIEGDLRREIALNKKRLGEIACYRGLRHRRSLPCRGQRTKTNARTRRGSKRTVSVNKK